MDDRGRPDSRREIGRLTVDEDVDVRPELGTDLDKAITDTWDVQLESSDDGRDRPRRDGVAPFGAGKQGQQRARQQDRGHGVGRQPSRTTDSTDQIAGRFAVTKFQLTPASALCQSWPVPVPNDTPTGSSVSRAMASRSTDR